MYSVQAHYEQTHEPLFVPRRSLPRTTGRFATVAVLAGHLLRRIQGRNLIGTQDSQWNSSENPVKAMLMSQQHPGLHRL